MNVAISNETIDYLTRENEMEERRQISRIEYNAQGVIVIVEEEIKIPVKVANVSPLGMGVLVEKNAPALLGKDIIIVADCLVMYANVNRVADYDENYNLVGIEGKTFDEATLGYLFDHIG